MRHQEDVAIRRLLIAVTVVDTLRGVCQGGGIHRDSGSAATVWGRKKSQRNGIS